MERITSFSGTDLSLSGTDLIGIWTGFIALKRRTLFRLLIIGLVYYPVISIEVYYSTSGSSLYFLTRGFTTFYWTRPKNGAQLFGTDFLVFSRFKTTLAQELNTFVICAYYYTPIFFCT